MEENTLPIRATLRGDGYYTEVKADDKTFFADEPLELGGTDLGPTPMIYLLGALASCTTITIKMYAKRKEWDTGEIYVSVRQVEIVSPEGKKMKIVKTLQIEKPLSTEQIEKLVLIGSKCPVSKLLEKGVDMEFESSKQ